MFQLRNQAPLEPKENTVNFSENEPRKPVSNAHADDPYHTDSSAYTTSDDEGTTKRKKNGKENGDEGLLVRSTISRDTTQNKPTVDSIDLSKMAAQTGDLPLNAREHQKTGAGRHPGAGVSLPPPAPPDFAQFPPPNASPPPPQNLVKPPLPSWYQNQPFPLPPTAPTSILGKIMPGRDLRTVYRETWSDKPRYATYNWRDKLRMTTRRKSESNLDIYPEKNKDSWISQHLPPNASTRSLVKSWQLAGHQIEQESEEGLPQKTDDHHPLRDLGANLGRVAEGHLGLNLYDDSPQSMFFCHLLDTIEALRAERNFYENLLTRPQVIRPPPANAPDVDPDAKEVPEFKILHRVFCKSPMHSHDQVLFEDAPTRVFSERSQDLALSAKMIVRNIDHYCSQHPNISFIIFNEYLCVEDAAPRARFEAYERRNRVGAEISPRAQRMCIVSDILRKALYHVASCLLLQSRISSRGMQEMAAPYLFLYHHREALHQYEEETTGLVRENVSLLLGFLDSDYGAEYREADAEFAKGILTFKHIEKLYRPNEIVIEQNGAHYLAYMVREWPEVIENEMKVSCWSWQYNGMFLQRQDKILKIKLPLPETYTVDKLPFCPIAMAGDAVIETLRERGMRFWSMNGQYFGCFSGLDINKIQFHHHIRVVVDMFTYSKMHPSKITPPSLLETSRFDPWPNTIPRENELDDSMVLLLPPHVFGFMLQEKQWLKLDINGIHPIEWNKRAFDRLVLDPKTKELITALVEVRIKTGRAEDIIGGKGNGLMILLHGGPGTGKTLTAESVAEIAEKPLYRVTCGDIGTKADDVEKYLQTVLYLGKIWNCVLLLDEADIFLEERTIADLERNSLVSVFLRILEYYDGILIMTSNRVGTFDEAFKSRIQVSLHYEDLTKRARQMIWSNFIVMLEEAGEDVNISDLESHLEEIASEEMNGRQIRNAMTTARQLALHRGERLHWEHLDQVLKTAREFNRYLKNVQGHTDKQWAREQRLR